MPTALACRASLVDEVTWVRCPVRASQKSNSVGVLLYCSIGSLPVSIIMAATMGEFERLADFTFLADTVRCETPRTAVRSVHLRQSQLVSHGRRVHGVVQGFQAGLLLSVLLGVVITFAIALCATRVSPLATAVTGNAKDIVTTAVGAVLFGGFVVSFTSIFGLVLSFFGAALFAAFKYNETLSTASAKSGADASPMPIGDSDVECEEPLTDKLVRRPFLTLSRGVVESSS